MNSPAECIILGGWCDVPITSLERRVIRVLKHYLKEQKQPRVKRISACGSKCVRGQLILILYIASNGKHYQAIVHDDINQLYVRSVEEYSPK